MGSYKDEHQKVLKKKKKKGEVNLFVFNKTK